MAVDIGDRIKSAFAENLNLKLLSLAFALVLYSLVHGAQDAQRSMSVSLVVLLPPDTANRVLVNQLPPQVRITLRGPRPVLDDLRAEDIGNIQVDMRSASEKLALEPTMVHVPASVHVEQIDPPVIDLQWEDRVAVDLPIQVSVVGTPAPGFVVQGKITTDPPNVVVRGPKSEVGLLQHVRADAFDVQGLTEGSYPHQLALDRPRGRVTLDRQSIRATVTVTRAVAERTFAKVAVQVVGLAKAKAGPTDVEVRVVCPTETLNGMKIEHILARVEVPPTHEPAGSLSLPVTVALDDRCTAHVTPPQVVVKW